MKVIVVYHSRQVVQPLMVKNVADSSFKVCLFNAIIGVNNRTYSFYINAGILTSCSGCILIINDVHCEAENQAVVHTIFRSTVNKSSLTYV